MDVHLITDSGIEQRPVEFFKRLLALLEDSLHPVALLTARGLADGLEDLLETSHLLLRLVQMRGQRFAQLLRVHRLRHFG